jgi:hypothetical protein
VAAGGVATGLYFLVLALRGRLVGLFTRQRATP